LATTKMVLIMEYEGTRYHGFQLQADLPTIQEETEKALLKLTGEKTRVMMASRTDTGVHARGQVVSFKTKSSLPVQTFVNALNYHLPNDIGVRAAHRVDDSFNVRRNAVSREYRYSILNSPTPAPLRRRFSCLIRSHLNIDAMNKACQALIGKHDLASFASSIGDEVKSTIREVYRAEVKREGDTIIFTILASSFLPHQVRNTIGALIKVGQGKMSVDEFHGLLETKKPGQAGPTAPACGLCLIQVNYPQPFEGEIL